MTSVPARGSLKAPRRRYCRSGSSVVRPPEAASLAKESHDAKQDIRGSNDDDLATAKESLETAETTKTEDTMFLESLIPMCAEKQKEYVERESVRAQEEVAVAQAISTLSSEGATASFGSIDATSFLRINNKKSHAAVRESVKHRLQAAARKFKSMRLAKIAMSMESDPFAVVAKAIRKQTTVIDKEEKADDDEKAFCDDERTKTDEMLKNKETELERLDGEVDGLPDELDNPDTGLKAVLAETQSALKETKESQTTETEARQEENALYQKTIANLITAEKVIEKAPVTLKKFYDFS